MSGLREGLGLCLMGFRLYQRMIPIPRTENSHTRRDSTARLWLQPASAAAQSAALEPARQARGMHGQPRRGARALAATVAWVCENASQSACTWWEGTFSFAKARRKLMHVRPGREHRRR